MSDSGFGWEISNCVGMVSFRHPHAQDLGQRSLMVQHPLVNVWEVSRDRTENTNIFRSGGKGYWSVPYVEGADRLLWSFSCLEKTSWGIAMPSSYPTEIGYLPQIKF